MIFLRARLAMVLVASLRLAACSHESAATTPDPQAILQAIPAADSAKYQHLQNMKNWQNPYLIVRADGVALLDVADSAEIILKTDELLPALAKLPPSNWPYGRVVAAAEGGTTVSDQDRVAIRRNKGIVGGLLDGAHIAIRWVPSA
ncbi:MAG: hypothetical protein WCB05_17885 [Candidatus Sulfotelmatobacter sp.]